VLNRFVKYIIRKFKSNILYFSKFVTIGVFAAIIDYFCYLSFYSAEVSLDIAKFLAASIGLLVSYHLNFSFNFGKHNKKTSISILKYAGLYSVLNLFNVGYNRIVFDLTDSIHISFLIAGIISAGVNYIVVKKTLFRGK